MSNARFRTALLGSGAAVALMAASVPASADELNDLRGQIEALQSKLATLEQNQIAAQQEQQYVAAPANAVVGGDKPGSFRLPGSNTSVAIGGYAKLDVIYDFDPDAGDSFGVGGIALETPSGNPGDVEGNVDNQFTLHAKQSRLWVKTWTPTDWGEFATHIEFDFEGGEENHLVSNSSKPRLRHAYGRLGNILAGQTWSNFNTPWQWPGTIDFNGTIGTSFIRAPQVRYTASLGDGMSLAVSLENPDTDGIACNTTDTFPCTDTHATAESIGGTAQDVMPEIVGRLQWGADWGTVAVAAVGRYFSVRETSDSSPTNGDGDDVGNDDGAFGWGLNLAAVVNLPWGKDSAGAQFIYGDGIGRYALWNVGQAFIVTDQQGFADDHDIKTLDAWGGNVWIEHWWTDNLYSVAALGYAETEFINASDLNYNTVQATAHVNLQWKPTSRANIGIEGIYGHRQTSAGADADHLRIQMGFTWGFGT